MEDYKKLSEYDIRTTLSMTDLFPTLVDNGDGTYSNKNVPLSSIKTYSAVTKADIGLGNVDNTSDVNKPVSTATTAAIRALYPIGSVYINASDSTNPGTLLGFGTWVAFGSGRVPLGMGDNGTTNYTTIGATGGEEKHLLTAAESGLPAHNHGVTDPGHAHYMQAYPNRTENASYGLTTASPGFTGDAMIQRNSTGWATVSNVTSISINNSSSTSASTSHNVMQPYITVYMWKRTA